MTARLRPLRMLHLSMTEILIVNSPERLELTPEYEASIP